MPWSSSSLFAQREQFVRLARQHAVPFCELCRQFNISRKTGYKWMQRREQEGVSGLRNRSRQPAAPAVEQQKRWLKRAVALRRARRAWGAKKLRVLLGEKYGWEGLPSVRTLERWWKEKGLLRAWRPARRGPAVPHPGLTVAHVPQQVWTIDFKGWYRTRDGVRQEPLTVRDLFTRYVLAVCLLPNQNDANVRRVFGRLFREHGLPRAIRVDNGSPFGGKGALGLTRLSVWWLRLGIQVEFTRPARPGDNAGHEQMHAVFAAEIAADPGANRTTEQRRIERWRKRYNEERPHEALAGKRPSALYERSARRMPAALPEVVYPAGWAQRRVRPHGDIKWDGRLRFIGRAFVRQTVGLKKTEEGCWSVYLGELLLGELRREDPASMRPARWQRASAEPTAVKATARRKP
jgi:putative transposase